MILVRYTEDFEERYLRRTAVFFSHDKHRVVRL